MLLPTCLRSSSLTALVRVLVQPIVDLSDRRLALRSDTLFQLQHTGQVVYLRHALNAQFGLTRANGFEIEDIVADGEFLMTYDEDSDQVPLIPIAADETAIAAKRVLCNWLIVWDEDTVWATTDFIVWCPRAIADDANKLYRAQAVVEQYRLLSRFPEYRKLQK